MKNKFYQVRNFVYICIIKIKTMNELSKEQQELIQKAINHGFKPWVSKEIIDGPYGPSHYHFSMDGDIWGVNYKAVRVNRGASGWVIGLFYTEQGAKQVASASNRNFFNPSVDERVIVEENYDFYNTHNLKDFIKIRKREMEEDEKNEIEIYNAINRPFSGM
jgi:hypothetical protein